MTLTMADLDLDPVRFTLRSLTIDANELEAFASCLQGELKKIEGFRNELPMTTAVLNDLICDVRERMVEGSGKVVLKQLFPAKSERLEVDGKREWMDAAVLWSGSKQKVEVPSIGREGENGGRKSRPFDVDRMARSVPGSIRTPLPYHSLEVPLVAPAVMGSNCGEANRSLGLRSSRRLVGGVALEFPSSKVDRQQQQQQATRKARRCWSRELHRKFESALEQLGGPDVATPKQIREVMKVEGLTNDEVKSHLQKYRIHSKKMSPAVKLDLHLKTSPVHSPNSTLELSHFGASWIGHRPGSCGYESTIDRCNGEVSG